MLNRLSDSHRVILAAAASRDDGAIFPLPDTLKVNGAARDRMLLGLRDRGLLLEVPCPVGATPWRRDEDGAAFALHIADAGLRAIGIEPHGIAALTGVPADAVAPYGASGHGHDAAAGETAEAPSIETGSAQVPRLEASPVENASPTVESKTALKPRSGGSKQDAVLTLLRRDGGATVAEMMEATNWQPHSVRGFLAGAVKKKLGLNLIAAVEDRGRVYRVVRDQVTLEGFAS